MQEKETQLGADWDQRKEKWKAEKLKNRSEKSHEEKFRKGVLKRGGKAYKFSSPSNSGVFDRLVVFPGNRVFFVELKKTGEKLSPLQTIFKQEVEAMGCQTFLVDSDETAQLFFHAVDSANL